MNSPPVAPRPRRRTSLRDYLELVKFGHTVFALPFALASMLVAADKSYDGPSHGGLPPAPVIGWIVVAMVAARTAAMGFNRIADRHLDAANPRTAGREIPAGLISVAQASTLVGLSALLFVFAASRLNTLALALALPTLAVLFFYSYCKRFTSLAHLVLGFCLGIAPAGAWIAVRGTLEAAPALLAVAVMFWVAGFDVIYATLDADFDRKAGLHSLVQKLGVADALAAARVFHVLFVALLLVFGGLTQLSTLYFAGVALIALFLIYEHALVDPRDLRRVNAAFFTVNGVISVFFLAVVAASLLVG